MGSTGLAVKTVEAGRLLIFIHIWLQPGVTRCEIERKPFKRFPHNHYLNHLA
jgi:hypothetical protein